MFEDLRASLSDFRRACVKPRSLDITRNPFVGWGILWGLSFPALLLAHHLSVTDAPVTPASLLAAWAAFRPNAVVALFPLLFGWVFGTLGTLHQERTATKARTIGLLETEVARRTQSLRDTYLQTVLALSAAIEAKHAYTYGHSQRVWAHSRAMATRLHVSPEAMEILRYACYLHDIGKLHVPSAVLDKPGRLTEEEFEAVAEHSAFGERILAPISGLRPVAALVRCHHERCDGSGYPDGLKRDDIPLLGRILAVADAFDAMVSDRPYRPPMSPQAALEELRRCAALPHDPALLPVPGALPCHHFDPDVVGAFAAAMADDPQLVANATSALPDVDATVDPLWAEGEEVTAESVGTDGKINCWEALRCGQACPGGPPGNGDSRCAVPRATRLDGINGGANGGRICWAVPGAWCRRGEPVTMLHGISEKCLGCEFLDRVRREEGLSRFRLVPP